MKYLNNSIYLYIVTKGAIKVIMWDSESKGEVWCEQSHFCA